MCDGQTDGQWTPHDGEDRAVQSVDRASKIIHKLPFPVKLNMLIFSSFYRASACNALITEFLTIDPSNAGIRQTLHDFLAGPYHYAAR